MIATFSDSTGARIGNREPLVGSRQELVRQARAFAAEQDRDGAAEFGRRAAACRVRGTARRWRRPRCAQPARAPRTRLPHGDRQPERAAHRAAQRLPAERVGGAIGGDDAGGTAAVGGPDDRADIARVLNAVEQQDQLHRAREHVVERRGSRLRQRDDARRLTNRAHRRHHRRGHADRLGAGAADAIDESSARASTTRLGQRDRLEGDAGGERLLDQMLAVEQDHSVRPAPARELAEARDEGIGAAGDAAHVGPL